ncbi:MAG: aldo/keto reductase [Burkholderiales bacterium]|nr:aldo/keto reductase [Burkholderiales bacterium]
MDYRKIGTTDVAVSVLSLGSWNTYNRMLFEDAVDFIRTAHGVGVNFFDTSFYPVGPHQTLAGPHTEVIFGRMLEAAGLKRDDYVLTEKIWFYSYPEQSLDDQINRSLYRLNLKHADILSVAMPRDDTDWTAILEQIAGIIRSGRARMWGAMNWTAAGLRRGWEICAQRNWPLPQVVQIKYNVLRRNVIENDEWRKLFEDTGITMQTSDSLEGGLLAGKLTPQREIGSDNGGLRPRFVEQFAEYKKIADKLGVSPAQLALAFCLTHPRTTSILAGVSSVAQLNDNIGAIAVAKRYGERLKDELAAFDYADHMTDKAYRGRLPVDDLAGFKGSYVRPPVPAWQS